MLIDITYFNSSSVNIPNTDAPDVRSRLTNLITEREPELLERLLGYALAEAFKTGIAAQTPVQKWIDLRDGKVYTINGKTVKWKGLNTVTPKDSIIANYVWYWWSRNNATNSTGIGETSNKADNATRVSPAPKQSVVWSRIRNWSVDLYVFLENNQTDYPEWERCMDLDFLTSINEFGI